LKRTCFIALVTLLLSIVVASAACSSRAAARPSPTQALSDMPSLAKIVKKVLPSVVYISDVVDDPINGPVDATGSGVILRADGYLLTNKHVVEGATDVQVTLNDRTTYNIPESNIWMDDMADLAVIKIDAKGLPVSAFADPESISVGDWVVAIGNALGLSPVEGGPTVTDGIVSNLSRSLSVDTTQYYDLIQTSAAINPGNSGGPLVNMDGEVIGINSLGSPQAQNIGFAINAGTAKHIFDDLVLYGRPDHPYLGAVPGDITADAIKNTAGLPKMGALITAIDSKGPADLAGIHKGDVILQFENDRVTNAADLIKLVWRHSTGDMVQVKLWRKGHEMTLNVTLGLRQVAGAI
jgi:serine protease Do